MKPAHFAYHRPTRLDELLDLLAGLGPDAKLLAGGQSLVPLMNFRLAAPAHVIDINRVPELEGEHDDDGALVLGALTRHRRLTERDFAGAPLLSLVGPWIGHPQIRTRGTLGGSISHADGAAELPGAAVALDARIIVRSVRGERVIPAGEFFVHHLTTALADDEVVTAVRVPAADGPEGCGFAEVATRHGDFALAGAMVRVVRAKDDPRRLRSARVVLIGVAPTPVRVEAAERALLGDRVDESSLRDVEEAVRGSVQPSPSPAASAEYLVRVAGSLARRATVQAVAHVASTAGASEHERTDGGR